MSRIRLPRWLEALAAPLLLALVVLLGYGLLFPWLGFYWDDYHFAWISAQYGGAGLARYFSTNRPIWGLIYQVTTALLGQTPWHWQVFALVWRWLSALALWLTLGRVWPQRRFLALSAALLFAIYPGFGQQSGALMYSHFFIVLAALLFSFYFGLRALQAKPGAARVGWLSAALVTALINLLCMEYFFLLELLRPVLYALALPRTDQRTRLRQTVTAWLPFLVVFIGAGIWRFFFFPYQTQNYEFSLLANLRAAPLQTLGQMALTVLREIGLAGVAAWGLPFQFNALAGLGTRTLAFYAAAVLGAGLSVALLGRPAEDSPRRLLAPLALGLLALAVAGWPFWLTGLPLRLHFPNDRFTLPFILGSALLLAGLIGLLPHRLRLGALALLVGLSAGWQLLNADAHRRDWNTQRTFFWQLSWRIPALEPNTLLLTNDLPLQFYSDNSLTAPLNWVYAPDAAGERLPYLLYFPTVRAERLAAAQSAGVLTHDYLVATFEGDPAQAVALVYAPPGCLRVIDPQIEAQNGMLPVSLREAMAGSSAEWIDAAAPVPQLPRELFGLEPAAGWCMYFEQADRARQLGDWQTAADLGDVALAGSDHPNDPAERLVFIEAYAHLARWDEALAQTEAAAEVTPLIHPPLCALWQRIAADLATDPGLPAALAQVQSRLACTP